MRLSKSSRILQLLEHLLLVHGDARADDRLDLAREHRVERKVGREAVVGAARVLVVVGADLLGATARAHLRTRRREGAWRARRADLRRGPGLGWGGLGTILTNLDKIYETREMVK